MNPARQLPDKQGAADLIAPRIPPGPDISVSVWLVIFLFVYLAGWLAGGWLAVLEGRKSTPEAPKLTPEAPKSTPEGSQSDPGGSKIDTGGSWRDPGLSWEAPGGSPGGLGGRFYRKRLHFRGPK